MSLHLTNYLDIHPSNAARSRLAFGSGGMKRITALAKKDETYTTVSDTPAPSLPNYHTYTASDALPHLPAHHLSPQQEKSAERPAGRIQYVHHTTHIQT